jgi:hypothetical protein
MMEKILNAMLLSCEKRVSEISPVHFCNRLVGCWMLVDKSMAKKYRIESALKRGNKNFGQLVIDSGLPTADGYYVAVPVPSVQVKRHPCPLSFTIFPF